MFHEQRDYKKWLYAGAAILLISLLGLILGTYWGISSSFAALETNESASIDAMSGGIKQPYSSKFCSR
jgi:biopolymer transport protein ExbB/TolQ